MTEVRCVRCTKPVADNGYLCSGCAAKFREVLAFIEMTAMELDTTITRQSKQATPSSGSRSTQKPLPVNWDASIDAGSVANTISTWCRHISEERGQTITATTIAGHAEWLHQHVEWIRHRPEADEIVGEITYAAAVLQKAIDRAPDVLYAGWCEKCGLGMYALDGKAYVSCPDCLDGDGEPIRYEVAEQRAWMLAQLDDELLPAADLCSALTHLDEPVTVERIYKWKERGRILAHGEKPYRYRVGDVRELLAERARKKATA